jgi:hypothetical protein
MLHKKLLGADLWQARVALLSIVALQWLVQGELHLAGRRIWVLTALELILLVALTFTSERHVRRARAGEGVTLRFIEGEGGFVRVLAMVTIGLASIINLAGLVRLILSLLDSSKTQGVVLLADALNLFATNVIVSGLWYWELDRGGPFARCTANPGFADFLFPQMAMDKEERHEIISRHWRPHFGDYLYLAFTNATAFSPTDTLPLTRTAKLVMAFQSAVSLMTIAIVAARAVNILA